MLSSIAFIMAYHLFLYNYPTTMIFLYISIVLILMSLIRNFLKTIIITFVLFRTIFVNKILFDVIIYLLFITK